MINDEELTLFAVDLIHPIRPKVSIVCRAVGQVNHYRSYDHEKQQKILSHTHLFVELHNFIDLIQRFGI